MLFSSLTFLIGFLPLVAVLIWRLRKVTSRDVTVLALILASLVFYGWHYPPYIGLLSVSILVNYGTGQLLARHKSLGLMWAGVAFNLGLLAYFKYAGLFVDTFNDLTRGSLSFGTVILPLAISFFTFQQIAYQVDMYRREVAAGNFLDYVFFVTFFPQLIAGPIVHYRQLMPQLQLRAFARFDSADVISGLLLFSLGLAKKVLIADRFRAGADTIFIATANGVEPSLLESWVGMTCYAFQIYFDFSGYSDMAVGLGRIFGLKLPKNFESPYKSANIIDFWRRWNITLSHFLRDYLYFPLGGNRRGPVLRYVNLFIVMLLGGLWHGASWTFVVWGALHGSYLTINHAWRHFGLFRIVKPAAVLLTFFAVIIAWVFFRADGFGQAFTILEAMLGLGDTPMMAAGLYHNAFFLPVGLAVVSLFVWFTPNALQIVRAYESGTLSRARERAIVLFTAILLSLSLFTVYSTGTYEFLYFQF